MEENIIYKTEPIDTKESEILIACIGLDSKSYDTLCAFFHKRVGYAILKVDSLERTKEIGYNPEMILISGDINLDKLDNIEYALVTATPGKEGDNAYSLSTEINPNTNNPYIEDTIEDIIDRTLSNRNKSLLGIYQEKISSLISQINTKESIETIKQELLELLKDKDLTTYKHTIGVTELIEPMINGMTQSGNILSEQEINNIYAVALIHDIGKLTIPDQLIKNNDQLSAIERPIMNSHAQLNLSLAMSDYAEEIYSLASKHHYRYDGKGYPPQEEAGNDIPIVSRMITVIDSFEAMTSTSRAYQSVMPLETAFGILYNNSLPPDVNQNGGQFDPKCAYAFLLGFKDKFNNDIDFQKKWLARENIEYGSQTYLDRFDQINNSLENTIHTFENTDSKHI